MNIRQRRKLGVTLRNLAAITAQLKKAGKLDGLPNEEIAVEIMKEWQLSTDLTQAPDIDWDALLDFIERLIPVILKIIDLFS
jgi:hypothetical protein